LLLNGCQHWAGALEEADQQCDVDDGGLHVQAEVVSWLQSNVEVSKLGEAEERNQGTQKAHQGPAKLDALLAGSEGSLLNNAKSTAEHPFDQSRSPAESRSPASFKENNFAKGMSSMQQVIEKWLPVQITGGTKSTPLAKLADAQKQGQPIVAMAATSSWTHSTSATKLGATDLLFIAGAIVVVLAVVFMMRGGSWTQLQSDPQKHLLDTAHDLYEEYDESSSPGCMNGCSRSCDRALRC
jgi:hypothetical protein